MSDLSLHQKVLALRDAKKLVTTMEKELSEELTDEMVRDLADPEKSTDRRVVVHPSSGEKVGQLSLVQPEPKLKPVNESRFVGYLKASHPELVETVTETRPKPNVLDQLSLEETEHGELVDVETGEVVPGLKLVEGRPYLRASFQKGWKEHQIAQEALRGTVPLLEEGEQS
ncbi:hypothetical protein ACFP47_10330 [Nesterenkonia lacusekhoensis]|uniref:HK97 gp10 family phage protein n=1 Tax=Nesterenkonia lacusekhoensis TaxID=150832 RepID=A0ABS4T6T5_9MICC|nr:hypothetical protein [Nesterenkonia lacusekhoensis]MBP2319598.1 hypothetical protein [Nesterenkonia lacusekhoensis]